jgi:hypothetical protein
VHPKRRQNPNAKRPKHPHKDYDRLIAAAWEAGWWVERGGKNYLKCMAPTGGWVVHVPSTPSSQATLRNKRAQFRRYGLKL